MKRNSTTPVIGFIGQGFIGKNMADDFEERGFAVVRYSLEEPHVKNDGLIATCDIVFIAVPTPTTPKGFDAHALRVVLPLVGKGKVAVIKSTILPGTTQRLQEEFPHCTILHSPEFLREKTAAEDTRKPPRNIIGMPKSTKRHKDAAARVLAVLPKAPYERVCDARSAELIKYGGNCFLAMKVVYMNLLYDLAEAVGADYAAVADAMSADERIGTSHMKVVDTSGHRGARRGRGAGGHCFPKDFAALREHAEKALGKRSRAARLLKALELENLSLLLETDKDMDLLHEIYGNKLR